MQTGVKKRKPAVRPMEARAAEREGRITGPELEALLKATGLGANDLAQLLNISPITVGNWIDDSKQQSPTSTMFLILYTLLVAHQLVQVPPADEITVQNYLAPLLRSGILKPRQLEDPAVMAPLRREIAIQTNRHLVASRKLLEVLQGAWGRIDAGGTPPST